MSRRKEKCIVCGTRTELWNMRSVMDEIPVVPGITLVLDGLVCKWEFGSEGAWEAQTVENDLEAEDQGNQDGDGIIDYTSEHIKELAERLRLLFWLFFRSPDELFASLRGDSD